MISRFRRPPVNPMRLQPLEHLDDPGRWPLLVQSLVILMACLLVCLLYYEMLLAPALAELEQKRNRETELRQSLLPHIEKTGLLPDLEQQKTYWESRLHQARHPLARYSDLPYLVSELARLGKQHQLELELARTGGSLSEESFDIITTELRLKGRYPAYLEFLEDIARLPYMTTLHDIRIQQAQDSLLIMATLRTYIHKQS